MASRISIIPTPVSVTELGGTVVLRGRGGLGVVEVAVAGVEQGVLDSVFGELGVVAGAAAPELPREAVMNHAVAKCEQGCVPGRSCRGGAGRTGGRAGVMAGALLLAAAVVGGCAQPQGPSVRMENAPGSPAVGRFGRGSEVVFSGDAVREMVGDDVFAASGDGARRDAALSVMRYTGLPDDSWVTDLRPALERPVYVFLGRYQENYYVYYRPERRGDRGR